LRETKTVSAGSERGAATPAKPADLVSTLCPACALCCNGVLFADVRLQAGDDAAQLAELGVPLKRRGAITRFSQPCSCLEGKLCRIYADRPARCRTFECRLLKRAVAGEVTERAALKSIQEARTCADKVRRILRELGDTVETIPLSRRYQRMMRQPIDLSADEWLINLRGELMLAVSDLAGVLEREFLT
jgi:Fe-S-cluster containining protein